MLPSQCICSHARNCDRSINYFEESIIFYTGLPDFITVKDVFEIESLIKHGAEQSCMQSVCEMNMYSIRQTFKLRRVNEFVIGLMRLILVFLVKEKYCELQCFKKCLDTSIVLDCTIPSTSSLENKSVIYSAQLHSNRMVHKLSEHYNTYVYTNYFHNS